MVYASLFMLFEYLHIAVEPFVKQIAGEVPLFQVGINLLLALTLLPIELNLAVYLKRKDFKFKKERYNQLKLEIQNK